MENKCVSFLDLDFYHQVSIYESIIVNKKKIVAFLMFLLLD